MNDRLKNRIVTGVCFLMLLSLVAVLLFKPGGKVRTIYVTGAEKYSVEEVAGFAGISTGVDIKSVSEQNVRKMLSKIDDIEFIDLEIREPDTVILEIREREVRAVVNCSGVYLLIDEYGYILGREAERPEMGAIYVSGIDLGLKSGGKMIESNSGTQLDTMQELLSLLKDSTIDSDVEEINLNNMHNIYLLMRSGLKVMLGDTADLDTKLLHAAAMLSLLTRDGVKTGMVDVSTSVNAVYSAA